MERIERGGQDGEDRDGEDRDEEDAAKRRENGLHIPQTSLQTMFWGPRDRPATIPLLVTCPLRIGDGHKSPE